MICMSCKNQSRSHELLSFFSRWRGVTEGISSAVGRCCHEDSVVGHALGQLGTCKTRPVGARVGKKHEQKQSYGRPRRNFGHRRGHPISPSPCSYRWM